MPAPRGWGVRARVQAAFALVGLVVSVFLAAVSWNLTTTYLYDQRELAAARSALVSVDLLARRTTAAQPPTPQALVESAALGHDAVYVPPDGARAVSSTGRVGAGDLPRPLLARAAAGVAAQQRLVVDGRPLLAVALPVDGSGAVYVELFPLGVLDRTLRTLSLVLAGTAALAVLLAAGLGRWAAVRTLRPLRSLVSAASGVARGELGTRIDARGDPDLVPLAEAFNTTTDALRARVERDARFASDVSHELRSPLTTMLNTAELLDNRRDALSPTAREALDLLTAEMAAFRRLVDDLLEVSRDDQGLDLRREPVAVATFVRRLVERCAPGARVEVSTAAEDAVLDADPRRLERVLANLVDNARVHGEGLRDVLVDRAGDVVRIAVRDCGPGVDPADRDRLFDRFYRGGRSRGRTPGSGLGLAIVEQHVRAHGGRVLVTDAEPAGAAFVVELPAGERP